MLEIDQKIEYPLHEKNASETNLSVSFQKLPIDLEIF